ncbi:MAG: RtcB family protein [Saprospiraceae bacterium]|nr:RtcB family protein [Saprospiraceae bacterium]
MDISILQKLEDYFWEIPQTYNKNMRVPARVLALKPLLDAVVSDRSLDQLVNVASLPGIVEASLVMPDAHEGYGFPIGGVAATAYPHGVISPGGIGYDINCGVRLMVSDLNYEEEEPLMEQLSQELYEQIPSGVGKGGMLKLSAKKMDEVLTRGAEWAIENGMGVPEDLEHMESHGKLDAADPAYVSDHAKQRGRDQLGTIGAGNHFVEVDVVSEIFHPEAARAFGLEKGKLVILVHTGSRGLGHQVATDYIRLMMQAMPQYGYIPPDRELACVPFNSPEGQQYFKAMCAAANFAWCNRQVISWEVRKAWKNVFGSRGGTPRLLYDIAHNIAKLETYQINGEQQQLIVHRKGATRAFGKDFAELPLEFRHIGQPVLIPGSMGTESYVLVGTRKSEELSFGSSCHGAGRSMSRRAAKRQVNAPALQKKLKEKGIHITAGSFKGIAEEAPIAYKDVNLVVDTVHQAGIALRVAKLQPKAVIKG